MDTQQEEDFLTLFDQLSVESQRLALERIRNVAEREKSAA